MSDEADKPKIDNSPVPAEEVGERNPTSVFNNLDSLRKQSKLTVKRKTILVNVTVDKPPNNSYFRVNPDPEMMLDATVLRNAEGTNKTYYYVVPSMREHPKIKPRLRRVTIVLVYTWPAGSILLWPVPILDDRTLKAWKSARAAFELAKEKWTQMVWNEEESDYAIEIAEGKDMEDLAPIWPDKPFNELLKIGFDGKVTDNEDHPYVRRLRGILD